MKPEELTPEMNCRVSRICKRMLNQTGGSKLGKRDVVKKLVESPRAQDIDSLEARHIYFNPVFYPASENEIGAALAKAAKSLPLT